MVKKKSKMYVDERRKAKVNRMIEAFHQREQMRRAPQKRSRKKIIRTSDTLEDREWMLDWDCVHFGNGHVVIFARQGISVRFKPIKIIAPDSMESFVYLKRYLKNRLTPIRCSIKNQKLKIIDEINFSSAIQQFALTSRLRTINCAGAKSGNAHVFQRVSFDQALSNAKKMTSEDFKKFKSQFMDFLADNQSKEFKVIPCLENMAHINSESSEDAFLFSIKCQSGEILVLHENVNQERSTLLFYVKKDSYMKTMRRIYDYLQSEEINKRSSLRSKEFNIDSKNILWYKSVNHDDFTTWKSEIFRSAHTRHAHKVSDTS